MSDDRPPAMLKPIDIKRMARAPYDTVIRWLIVGHPRAGLLPSVDFAETGKRHSFRIHPDDWAAFQRKLRATAKGKAVTPTPIARSRIPSKESPFNY